MLDLFGLGIVALFALFGALRGTLASGLRIATLVAAYAGAMAGGPHLAEPVSERLGIPAILGAIAGGALAFLGTYIAANLISSLLLWWARRRREAQGLDRSALDRVGGATLGGLQGAVVVLLLGLLFSYVDALRHSPITVTLPDLPSSENSRIASWGRQMVEKGAEVALGDDGAAPRMTTRLLADPVETVERFQRVMTNPRIEELQRDRLFWTQVQTGAIDQAMNRGSFLGIAYDDTLRGELADLGMVSEAGRVDARLFRNSAKDVLVEMGPRLQHLKDDPAFRELAQDPQIGEALQQGDTMALFGHPDFRALVARTLDGPG